jgi:RHS repeat-associated protein
MMQAPTAPAASPAGPTPQAPITFSYDARGNLSQEQKSVSGILYTTGYGYNTNNVLTSITYPSGRTVTYTRDAAGRISQVDTTFGSTQTLASSITYMPFGPVSGLVYGNSPILVRTYDNRHRLTSTVTGTSLDLSYIYDANSNITTILDTSTSPGLTDAAGVYTYQSGTNRLASITGSTPITFGYDANGNITSQNTRTFTYDLLNRPVTILDNGTPIATYTYNAEGQRIKKTTPAGTTIFHYDRAGRLIAETTDTGSTIAEYVYLNDELLASIRSGTVYYYHNDHLGTPRVLTNSNGAIVWRAEYSPYGKAQPSIETTENPFRFPGQYYDAETGLHYNYHRYYQPETGRYITPDPIGLAGGINLYGYVGGNPVGWGDRYGLQAHQGFVLLLKKMTDKSLRKTIKSLEKQIEKHEAKIADWCEKQAMKHHRHEVDVFTNQLKLAQEEATRRGLFGTGAVFAEDITEEQAQRNTGGLMWEFLDIIGGFLGGSSYAY